MLRSARRLATIGWVAIAMPLAAQEQPQRAPGALLTLYDVGEWMAALPQFRPNSAPNVARAIDALDLKGASFAPLKDYFVSEVDGYLQVDEPGRYTFRLISDDGAKLWLDGMVVIDHDGLHGPEPRDAEIKLTAGAHALRLRHFDAGAGDQLTLQWRKPGAAKEVFEVVAGAALTHDPSRIPPVAEGKKAIIPSLRRGKPGDGSPLADVHPSYALTPIAAGTLPGDGVERRDAMDVLVFDGASSRAAAPGESPYVWLPSGESATTATTPSRIVGGPFDGQLLVAENPQGGIKRIFRDQFTAGENFCVFQFSMGLPSIIGALSWTSAGELIVGGRSDDAPHVVKLTPNGKPAFEMVAIRAQSNGLEIEFSQPLDAQVGWEPENYHVELWKAFQGKEYRGPQRDGSTLTVRSASVSEDRKRVFLEIIGLEVGLIYLRLLPPCVAESGERLWSTEAWYTLSRAVVGRSGTHRAPPTAAPQNQLTEAEKAAGWRLLFDGQSTRGWRGFRKPELPAGWQVRNGCLTRVGGGGDIVTEEQFENFELMLEWRISAGGNSGIFYRVLEDPDAVWRTGPEMQVLDNSEHADGRSPLTSAGSNYALHAPPRDVTRPIGFFNQVRLLVDGTHVEHWLNGEKLVEYDLLSPEWEELVKKSKFAQMPRFGRERKGHIALQDHGDLVWFRNIKIRELPPK